MVVAPTHPLATISGAAGPEMLKDHVCLVLFDLSSVAGSRDLSVYSGQAWRLSDLGAKQEMLCAGTGFGSLPAHLAKDDLATGGLVALELATTFGKGLHFPIVLVRRNDRPMGQATHWLVERLAAFNSVTYRGGAPSQGEHDRILKCSGIATEKRRNYLAVDTGPNGKTGLIRLLANQQFRLLL